jgi:hypothetical protein
LEERVTIVESSGIGVGLEVLVRTVGTDSLNRAIGNNAWFLYQLKIFYGIPAPTVHYSNKILIIEV